MDLQNRTQEVRDILARSHSGALSHQERTENERRLYALLEEDIVSVLQILIFIVVAPDNDKAEPGTVSPQAAQRELASIVFKNAVYKRAFVDGNPQLSQSDWFGVEASVRAQIREALLTTLGQDANASWKATKDVCLCLASIAVVEVPTGQWPDCVSLLAGQGSGNAALTFRMAAIHTLGLMQDSLAPSDLLPEDVNSIWGAMLHNVSGENLELAKIAAKAIARLAQASAVHFKEEQQRTAIMNGIFSLLEIQDDDILYSGLDALIEIAALNYPYMQGYLNQILAVTERLLSTQEQNHKNAGYSVEVWTTLFEAEHRNDNDSTAQVKHEVIRKFEWTKLATLFLNGLQHTGFDEADQDLEDETDASLSLACATALASLAVIVKDELLHVSFQFVSQLVESNTNNQSWTATYVALTALNGTVVGPSEETLAQSYASTLEWVYSQVQSSCQRVRCAAIILLSQLASHCPSLICANEGSLQPFMQCFQQGFKPGEHFRITVHAMQAAQNLFVSLAKRQGQVQLLNVYFGDIINMSISKILEKPFIQQGMVTAAQDCVNDIAQNCDNVNLKDQLLNLCDQVCNQIDQIISQGANAYNEEEIEQLVNNFGGLMQVLIVRLDSNLTAEMQQKIFQTVSNVCAKDSCRQGVLLMLNGLLNIMEQNNISSIATNITKVIETTIQGQGCNGEYPFDTACQRMATGLIQDLTTGLKEGITQYLQQMMNILIFVLEDPKFNTEVKTIAIIAIGDLCLMTEAGFQPYFQQAMQSLIQAGMMAVAGIDPNMPPEDQRNIHLLRQSLVDAFMSIINGIKSPSFSDENTNYNNQNQAPNQFDDVTFEHIRNMFFYLEKLVSMDDLEIDSDLARQILDLYCDIVMLQTFDPQTAQSQAQHDKITTFTEAIRKSQCHNQIQRKFNPYVNQINALDNGEAVQRFQEIVSTRVNYQS